MNILIIGCDVGEAHAYFPVSKRDISFMDRIEVGEISASFMSYKQGPMSKIEARMWDLIVITREAYAAIDYEEYKSKWLPACCVMSRNLIVGGEVIR